VILLSGGLDSAANLALCRASDDPILALTVRYGQKASDQEVRAARQLAHHYDVRHEVIDLEWLGALGGSSLTDAGMQIPNLKTSELDNRQVTELSAKSVWVPNRNGLFIQVAAAFAERFNADRVVVGFNREEAATFPDNSADFIARSSHALELSTATGVKVHCYTVDLNKTEIVRELRKQPKAFPFDLVWSCYHDGATPCGECESCRRFARATRENSVRV
jgi:7-cyano-7-deazaguanine synthase